MFGWEDPAITTDAVPHHSGIDFLREILAGRLPAPSIAAALGFTLEEAEHGRAVFVLVPGEEHYNPIGSVHGGVYATLLDSAAGCAVQSVPPRGMGYTSIDLTDDRLLAHATSSCILFPILVP
ncbi:PaaI family thioesterase [Streptomyces sp. NPDC058467]|uniref:PaaI family thioesterase n=1 Tax=Streptomyces sp. NPDC058467 TaxID=3346513 RepID=UPI00364F1DB9